jgi:putative GTP pyrophosphokinase
MTEYRELMMMYNCAMKQIHTKFEILNAEYNERYKRNPINFINTRLKCRSSIVDKMIRSNVPLSIENIEANIFDVAGVRVICSYVDDIYEITQALLKQGDITRISQKDYIANPKPNGYRSMHLIISVPVFFTDHMKHIKVEVQIRTIAMDFWATLEHELRYKNQITHGTKIAAELKECADIISETDARMLEIRKKIVVNEQTEDEILIERMKKLDFPIG